jgi:hypothetical protein
MRLLIRVSIVTLGQYILWLTATVLAFRWHGTPMIQWPSSRTIHGIVMGSEINHWVFNFQQLFMMATIL